MTLNGTGEAQGSQKSYLRTKVWQDFWQVDKRNKKDSGQSANGPQGNVGG
jgi:hypothetical protein